VLNALGAIVHMTPGEVGYDDPKNCILLAKDLKTKYDGGTILNQYTNPKNPISHHKTAQEILRDCENRVDVIIAGTGTGGTITGISETFRGLKMSTKIIGVDPTGSILADPEKLKPKPYAVEGIGYDFVPQVLDRSIVDHWISVDDKESFLMAKRLIREEGLLVGGSSGSAVAGALKAIQEFPELNLKGKRIVIILPDSIRNYLFKFISDEWMISKGFLGPPKCPKSKNLDLHLRGPLKVLRRKEIMKEDGLSFPILVDSENNDGNIVGLVDAVIYLKSKISGNNPVIKKNFIIVEEEASKEAILGFASTGYPIIVRSNGQYFKFDLESFFSRENIF
jgi:hypothetical protein